MRVVAGKYRGRVLSAPDGRDVRPTSDKVRGAIFNALEARGAVRDSYVIDVFCGTGALGIEALSRGARHCIFIDSAEKSLSTARNNAENLNIQNESYFIKDSAESLKNREECEGGKHAAIVNIPKASLVFCDPPYGQNLVYPAMKALSEGGWLENEAVFVVESGVSFSFQNNEVGGCFGVVSEKIYGDTKITTLIYENISA